MKKILSITTALASLVAFYSVNVSADSLVESEQSKQNMNNVNREVEQNKQRKISRFDSADEDYEHESETSIVNKAKTRLEEREKLICSKGDKICRCKHSTSFKEGPRITIGGGFDAQFHKTSDVKDYDVIPGNDKFTDSNALFGDFSNGLVADYSKASGSSVETILNVRAENTSYDFGLIYGADIKLNVPITKSGGMRSRGAYIFANTEVGDINIGFIEGAESIMRIDASKIAAGDRGVDSDWFRNANLEGNRGNFPFYVTPRLYSESLFSESNWLSFRDSLKYKKSFIDTQPFRVSYFSPSFMGFKAGVSYSPNYDSDLFTTGGIQKVKYIDPNNANLANNVNANTLNYSWYNTAHAALKAARALNDPNVNIADAADGAAARGASHNALNAIQTAYDAVKQYGNLPDIESLTASNALASGDDSSEILRKLSTLPGWTSLGRNIQDVAIQLAMAKVRDMVTNAADNDNDARIAARGTVIHAARATAKLAALASQDANNAVTNVQNGLPAVNPDRLAVVADDVATDNAVNSIMASSVDPEASDVTGRLVPKIAKEHAQNAAINAFRGAAIAQSALGINIGTAKEFYTLLATSGNYVGPNYENIVSGGISYEYDFDDFKIKVSATGEKGQVKEIKGDRYGIYGKYNDLTAFNLGLSAEYFGFKFAASYANLGKSGQPREICVRDPDNKYNCGHDKVDELQKDTYYWTAGAGYEFGNTYVSATYFKSKSAEANELSDIVVGAEYNLAPNSSKNPLTPYVTWHHFNTKEKDLPSDKKNNKGNIFVIGVKHSF